MDTGIIFALVLSVLFFGAIVWLVIYSRRQSEKHTAQTTIKPPGTQKKNRAA